MFTKKTTKSNSHEYLTPLKLLRPYFCNCKKKMNHGSIITTQFEPTTCTLINIRVFGGKQSIKIFNGTLKKWVEVITRQMLHSKLQHLTEGRISNIISVGDFSSSVINLTSGSRETSEFASSYWFYNYVHVLERHWV